MNSVFHIAAKALNFVRLVSIDIVLGAISGSYFASVITNTQLSVYYYFTLASAVWIIYIVDHILDGVRTLTRPNYGIYQFHFKHRILLLSVGTVLALISGYIVLFYLEKRLIIFGIFTFILVVLYLILNFIFRKWRSFFPKELIISVLYTWGIFGGVLILNNEIKLFQILIIVNYVLLVFANVLLFSFFDSEKSRNDLKIIASEVGKENTRKLIVIILSIAFIFSLVAGLAFSKWSEALILILMNISFLVIILFPSVFRSNKNFGLIADSVFIYPLLIYLFC